MPPKWVLINKSYTINNMWNYFKTNRLTILAILAGITYVYLIVNTVTSDWDSWKMAFNEGALGAEYNKWGDVVEHHPVESHQLFIRAKNGYTNFPDSIVNLTDNQIIKARYNEVIVLTSSKEFKHSTVIKIIATITSFMLAVVLILIPVHFYKIIGLIKRGILFDRFNVRLLRKLGVELLLVYVGVMIILYVMHQETSAQFRFSDYEIVAETMDPIWILLGIITFIIAEILSKAVTLKEEQELTI